MKKKAYAKVRRVVHGALVVNTLIKVVNVSLGQLHVSVIEFHAREPSKCGVNPKNGDINTFLRAHPSSIHVHLYDSVKMRNLQCTDGTIA